MMNITRKSISPICSRVISLEFCVIMKANLVPVDCRQISQRSHFILDGTGMLVRPILSSRAQIDIWYFEMKEWQSDDKHGGVSGTWCHMMLGANQE